MSLSQTSGIKVGETSDFYDRFLTNHENTKVGTLFTIIRAKSKNSIPWIAARRRRAYGRYIPFPLGNLTIKHHV